MKKAQGSGAHPAPVFPDSAYLLYLKWDMIPADDVL